MMSVVLITGRALSKSKVNVTKSVFILVVSFFITFLKIQFFNSKNASVSFARICSNLVFERFMLFHKKYQRAKAKFLVHPTIFSFLSLILEAIFPQV